MELDVQGFGEFSGQGKRHYMGGRKELSPASQPFMLLGMI
jgi:hypothetical protein